MFCCKGEFGRQHLEACHIAMMAYAKLRKAEFCQNVFGGLNLS